MFSDFISDIIDIEGLYSDDPSDSGGKTKYGITEATARAYGYNGLMKDLPKSLAVDMYKEEWWDSLRLDEVVNVSPRIAYKLLDMSVNVGTVQAGFFLQRLLNVLNNRQKYYNDIKADGLVGPITIATLHRFLNFRGHEGEVVLLRGLNCMQGSFYISLAERREKDEKFIYGWLRTRIDKGGTHA